MQQWILDTQRERGRESDDERRKKKPMSKGWTRWRQRVARRGGRRRRSNDREREKAREKKRGSAHRSIDSNKSIASQQVNVIHSLSAKLTPIDMSNCVTSCLKQKAINHLTRVSAFLTFPLSFTSSLSLSPSLTLSTQVTFRSFDICTSPGGSRE